ncbi:MAG: GNAT family N-acetyltransferase [Polyangiaceae bacterium]
MEPPPPKEVVLRDGTKVTLRPIRPEDGPGLREAFTHLSATSRHRRFFSGVSELTDEMVHYLTHVDGKNHVAIIATIESLDLKNERGVGVARFIRLKDHPTVAETAVTVIDEMQNRGLGGVLLRELSERAIACGIEKFRAEVLATNTPMKHLLEEVRAELVEEIDGSLVYDVRISTEHDSGLDRLFREAASQLTVFIRNLRPPEK